MHPGSTGYSGSMEREARARPSSFMVSSAADACRVLASKFARHMLCADPESGRVRAIARNRCRQPTSTGTMRGEVPAGRSSAASRQAMLDVPVGLGRTRSTLAATLWPTHAGAQPAGRGVSLAGTDWSLDPRHRPARVRSARWPRSRDLAARVAGWTPCPAPLLARRWYDVGASVIDDDWALVCRCSGRDRPVGHNRSMPVQACSGRAIVPAGVAVQNVLLAAMPPEGAAPVSHHMNGKLEQPALWRRRQRPRRGTGRRCVATPDPDTLLACWDFSRSASTASSRRRHRPARGGTPRLHGPADPGDDRQPTGPVRCMSGPMPRRSSMARSISMMTTRAIWVGRSPALHAHACRKAGPVRILQRAHLATTNGEDRIPFFVRPVRRRRPNSLCWCPPSPTRCMAASIAAGTWRRDPRSGRRSWGRIDRRRRT